MRATKSLLQHSLRLTLFTRDNCSLCTDAKRVLSQVWDRRQFEYDEVNVMQAEQMKWKNFYEYDTPVVHIDRIERLRTTQNNETHHSARKLMHRFSETEVEQVMDAVEGST